MEKIYVDDDGKEYPESYLDFEDYKKEYELLIDKLAKREEAAELLKIAHPSKIGEIRQLIAGLDDGIRKTEELLEMIIDLHTKKIEYFKDLEKLCEKAGRIEIELRAYVAEHKPEQLESLDAMLSGENNSH